MEVVVVDTMKTQQTPNLKKIVIFISSESKDQQEWVRPVTRLLFDFKTGLFMYLTIQVLKEQSKKWNKEEVKFVLQISHTLQMVLVREF